jgi:hypothetical protein
LIEQLEFGCLLFAKYAGGRTAEGERVCRIGDERYAVVLRPQIIGAVRLLPAAAVGDRIAHHDELWQVFVQRTESVVHP